MTKTTVMATALALAVTLPVVSAQAQAIRTFVSTTGSDSNPCTIIEPCRHFSAAVAATSVGGEVDALEPGAYGSFTISQAVTIEGQGWSYVAPSATGIAITINAVSGKVVIHGVSLNGVGATGATNGIAFFSGGSLTVTDCVVENFTENGINIVPSAGTTNAIISTTNVLNNGFDGIHIAPTASAIVQFSIAQTNASSNGDDGIHLATGTFDTRVQGMIAGTHIDFNGNNGITGIDNVYVVVKDSFVFNNTNNGLLAQNLGYGVAPGSGAGVVLDNVYFVNFNNDITITSSSVFSFGNNYYYSLGSPTSPISASRN
jgi:hypothetical protein